MTLKNCLQVWVLCITLGNLFFPSLTLSQELDDLKKLCLDATAANKAMAKQAGYDLDQICGEIATVEPSKKAITGSESDAEMVERNTVSSSHTVSEVLAPMAVSRDLEDHEINKIQLKPFGYDLFANSPTTYGPSASIPVSKDYLLGPGDTLDFLFYGKLNSSFSLEINREGFAEFPQLGPVGLAGLTFGEAREMLRTRVATQFIGTQVSVSMGSLRSMQIFVLGEAFRPGAYTVSSLSTITQALISSGGVSDIGSLRAIQLKRNGKLISVLDLYDLLLVGDTSSDLRLQEGDVIYIPIVGDLVSIEGQILRPAIYELKNSESIEELLDIAGGLGPKAFPQSTRLERIDSDGYITVLDLDLTNISNKEVILNPGDHLTIDSITDFKRDIVMLSGSVRHAGDFTWHSGMQLTDVIPSIEKLDREANPDTVLIVRERSNNVDIDVLLINLETAWKDFSASDNLELNARDRIVVLSKYGDRVRTLAPFVEKLKRQAELQDSARVVEVGGQVRFPGEYPLTEGMSLADLIDLSGGMNSEAYSGSAEIARIDISDGDDAKTIIMAVDLEKADNAMLSPLDKVEFRKIPNYAEIETILLRGEFTFPGSYAFEAGETLTSVIQRAGGFTDNAFIRGSVFQREALKKREQDEIDRLAYLMNENLVSDNLRNANSNLTINSDGSDLRKEAIGNLSELKPTGRLIISLEDIISFSGDDLILKDGDSLSVPTLAQEVMVLGEVYRPTSHIFSDNLSMDDYVLRSGGFTQDAARRSIYLVRASGEVVSQNGKWWRFKSIDASVAPGDTIVVPLDTNSAKISGLPLLAEVTEMIYQLAIGAAAVNSLTN
jgi:protein involved in polysaccharide export with SLBB domain